MECRWPQCQEQSEAFRKQHGCDCESEHPTYEDSDDKTLRIYRCPGKLLQPWAQNLVKLWAIGKGLQQLPAAGGLLDQTAIYLDSAAVITMVYAEVEEKKWQTPR